MVFDGGMVLAQIEPEVLVRLLDSEYGVVAVIVIVLYQLYGDKLSGRKPMFKKASKRLSEAITMLEHLVENLDRAIQMLERIEDHQRELAKKQGHSQDQDPLPEETSSQFEFEGDDDRESGRVDGTNDSSVDDHPPSGGLDR